jgi:hypothetical protein
MEDLMQPGSFQRLEKKKKKVVRMTGNDLDLVETFRLRWTELLHLNIVITVGMVISF